MRMNRLKPITILTMFVLLSCTWQPCSGFLLESLASSVSHAATTFTWEVIKLIIEGPTGLVLRALTYDYFGIGDFLWDAGWWVVDKGVKKIGTVGSALTWWSTIKIADTIYDSIKWVISTAVGGIKGTANFVKSAVGISTALNKLKTATSILKKVDPTSSTAKPDGVNVTVLLGRRSSNEDFTQPVSPPEARAALTAATLEETFLTACHYDQHLCLPLVLCAIAADNPSLRTAQENELAASVRLLLDLNPPPPWAKLYLQGVQLGIESREKQNKRICRKAFPRCPYPVTMLRKLIYFAFKNHGLKTFISEHQGYFVD